MQEFRVDEISNGKYHFSISGVSYIGNPLSNTAMYISKKVERLLENLKNVRECLIFAEDTIEVPAELSVENCFVLCRSPQKEYAQFVTNWAAEMDSENRKRKYTLAPGGYYVGDNVTIGRDAYIEPGCVISHDVTIGDRAVIKMGARIENCTVGDDFIACENCTVGTTGFTMADDDDGNKMRIPTLGRVIIGNHVEIGALTNVSRGSAGNTEIHDCVKLDSLVHIGHDVVLHRNVEIPAGAIIGGFDELMEGAYVGINAVLRNRIKVGEHAFIGMGAVVTKSVEANTTVVGNPAKPFERK